MRLIDADYVKSKLNKSVLGGHLHYYVYGVIDDAPTIDAEPVKHGRWENVKFSKGTYKFSEIGKDSEKEIKISINRAKCNICGNYTDRVTRGVLQMTPYCPNCGAKMDGGVDG